MKRTNNNRVGIMQGVRAIVGAGITVWVLILGALPCMGQILSESELTKQLTDLYGVAPCTRLWIGEYQIDAVAPSDGERYLAKAIKSEVDLGLIKIIDLPSIIGKTHFRTELVAGVENNKELNIQKNFSCIHATTEPKQDMEIVKIDPVQGGVTKWVGVIALVKLTARGEPTDLIKRYDNAMGEPPFSLERKMRVLFKYNPFNKTWTFLLGPGKPSMDSAPINGEFTSQNVPMRLRED